MSDELFKFVLSCQDPCHWPSWRLWWRPWSLWLLSVVEPFANIELDLASVDFVKEKHPQLSSSLFKDFSDQHRNVKISVVPVDMTMLLFLVFLSPNFYHLLPYFGSSWQESFYQYCQQSFCLAQPCYTTGGSHTDGKLPKAARTGAFFIFLCIAQVLQTINF